MQENIRGDYEEEGGHYPPEPPMHPDHCTDAAPGHRASYGRARSWNDALKHRPLDRTHAQVLAAEGDELTLIDSVGVSHWYHHNIGAYAEFLGHPDVSCQLLASANLLMLRYQGQGEASAWLWLATPEEWVPCEAHPAHAYNERTREVIRARGPLGPPLPPDDAAVIQATRALADARRYLLAGTDTSVLRARLGAVLEPHAPAVARQVMARSEEFLDQYRAIIAHAPIVSPLPPRQAQIAGIAEPEVIPGLGALLTHRPWQAFEEEIWDLTHDELVLLVLWQEYVGCVSALGYLYPDAARESSFIDSPRLHAFVSVVQFFPWPA